MLLNELLRVEPLYSILNDLLLYIVPIFLLPLAQDLLQIHNGNVYSSKTYGD